MSRICHTMLMVLLFAATVSVPVVVYLHEIESLRQYFACVGVVLILLIYVLLVLSRLFWCYVLVMFFVVWVTASIVVFWNSIGFYPVVLMASLTATYVIVSRMGKEIPF